MRYYFHSRDGKVVMDDEGAEFRDDGAARHEAVVLFAELLGDRPEAFWVDGRLELIVTDANGRQVAIIRAVGD